MQALTQRRKDHVGGALIGVLGIGTVAIGRTYPIGGLSRMGPGFFPVALGCILFLVGVAIAAGAPRDSSQEAVPSATPEWRGWFCIIAGIVAFAVIGRYGGFVPATFAVVFISALGDRGNTPMRALLLAAAMVAVCLVVFWWGLQIQLPLFTWGGM